MNGCMKRNIFLLLFIVLCRSFVIAQQKLTFENGKFKIVQFTDIHWTPEMQSQCKKSENTIKSILKSENPDLAVLSGDVVTANPAIEGWNSIVRIFEKAKVPFTVTMGNHDGEYLAKSDIYDLLIQSPYFVGEKGPDYIKGCGNFVLPVYSSEDSRRISSLIYCLDSNDYPESSDFGHYDWINISQQMWYRKESDYYRALNGGIPFNALAFFHIALPEFVAMHEKGNTLGSCNDGSGAPKINSGMFSAFVEQKDVMGVFVGHDHDNDYIGQQYGIALAYGRVTGANAYGEMERGARIIELYEGKRQFDTWISTPSGRSLAYYYPSGITSVDEDNAEYIPSLDIVPVGNGVSFTYYEGNFKSTDQISSGKKLQDGIQNNFSISGAMSEDHFAYEFNTYINIPETGIYSFYTYSDDGSRLFVDDRLVVDNDGSRSAQRTGGKIPLTKGFHKIRLLYFEDYMGQDLKVSISSRNIFEMEIPDDMLFYVED